MSDRLAEIKARWDSEDGLLREDDIPWLIAEVERLRKYEPTTLKPKPPTFECARCGDECPWTGDGYPPAYCEDCFMRRDREGTP